MKPNGGSVAISHQAQETFPPKDAFPAPCGTRGKHGSSSGTQGVLTRAEARRVLGRPGVPILDTTLQKGLGFGQFSTPQAAGEEVNANIQSHTEKNPGTHLHPWACCSSRQLRGVSMLPGKPLRGSWSPSPGEQPRVFALSRAQSTSSPSTGAPPAGNLLHTVGHVRRPRPGPGGGAEGSPGKQTAARKMRCAAWGVWGSKPGSRWRRAGEEARDALTDAGVSENRGVHVGSRRSDHPPARKPSPRALGRCARPELPLTNQGRSLNEEVIGNRYV